MEENRRMTTLMIIVLFFGMCVSPSIIGIDETAPSFDGDMTIVSIQPSAQTVEKGEWFNVGIYVEPSELIAGACADIYFDPTLIQADWVVEGDLFPGPYHFYPGTIDNINGKITNIGASTMTGEPVSDPGYLCHITFIAQQEIGTSPLDLQNVCITDMDAMILPSTSIDGEVTVEELPQITNIILTASEPLDTDAPYGWENISCTATDYDGVDMVKLIMTNDTATVEHTMINIPMTDTYYYNTTITQCGIYTYHIWAEDASENNATSSLVVFELPSNSDVNMDGRPHLQDFVLVAKHYNENGPDGWIREDVNNDGRVHLQDFVSIAKHYNEWWK